MSGDSELDNLWGVGSVSLIAKVTSWQSQETTLDSSLRSCHSYYYRRGIDITPLFCTASRVRYPPVTIILVNFDQN